MFFVALPLLSGDCNKRNVPAAQAIRRGRQENGGLFERFAVPGGVGTQCTPHTSFRRGGREGRPCEQSRGERDGVSMRV